MSAGQKPKVTWGTAYANTWEMGYPLDDATAWGDPREGSETMKAPSGVEDAWTVATDQFLGALARWIPAATGTTPEGTTITGWDGATGVDAAIAWLRAKNVGRFFPDRTSGTYVEFYLVEPMSGKPGKEEDGTRSLRFVFRSANDSQFTGY